MHNTERSGTLFIVSTPIGNLEDMTTRARRVLAEVDLIAAEDTRRTGNLLKAYGITARLTSFHSYNKKKKIPEIISSVKGGADVALVADSGTPGISDPGSALIAGCVEQGVKVSPIPGPTAFVAALVVSGKPTGRFVFEGFLSSKSARRKKQLRELGEEKRTVILYESPHRLIRFLEDFLEVVGDRELVIARELTKKFEEIKRARAGDLLEHFSRRKPRGEFIVVF